MAHQTDVCPLCLDQHEYASAIPELNGACIHQFCQKCIVEYVNSVKLRKGKIKCPICRAQPNSLRTYTV